jgi:hypothetical protein
MFGRCNSPGKLLSPTFLPISLRLPSLKSLVKAVGHRFKETYSCNSSPMLAIVSILSSDSIKVSSSRKFFASARRCFLKSLLDSDDQSRTSVRSSSSLPNSNSWKSTWRPNIARVLFLEISELGTREASMRAAERCMCSANKLVGNDTIYGLELTKEAKVEHGSK